MAPHRQVLPHQHTELVGRLVELRPGDVTEASHEIEAGVPCQGDVATEHLGGRTGQVEGGRAGVDALREQPLAVHRDRPVVHGELAEAGAAHDRVARRAVDEHLDPHVRQRLATHRPRPPQLRLHDVEIPGDLVDTGGERMVLLGEYHAVDRAAHPHRSSGVAVEPSRDAQVGPGVVGIAAHHPAASDAHRSGELDAHASPQATGVPMTVVHRAVLQRADHRSPRSVGGRGWTRHFDGEHVVDAEAGEVGDVECVLGDRAFGVAEVGAVEPHVGLMHHSVEHHERPLAGAGCPVVQIGAVHHGTVAVDERGLELPVAGHPHLGPGVVVVVDRDAVAPHVVVGVRGTPTADRLHVRAAYPRVRSASAGTAWPAADGAHPRGRHDGAGRVGPM